MGVVFSVLGLGVLVWRLWPAIRTFNVHVHVQVHDRVHVEGNSNVNLNVNVNVKHDARVSVIVPARNEEANLPKLLASLVRLPVAEIIVVDDLSEDRTAEIAREFASRDARVQVLRADSRPAGWTGKNWACQQGAAAASGDYLLFTDADTVHIEGSLEKAIALDADLVSAIPFHDCESFFEKLMGPFHLLVLISSSAFAKPRPRALFAIGQYLLFKREWYLKQGQHEAVRESFADDLDLAERCLKMSGTYKLETSGEIFRVRMYLSFREFLAGWRRIFRVGFGHATFMRVIEIFLVIACLTESFRFARATSVETLMALAGMSILFLAQRKYGQFIWIGALLAPIGLGTFVYVSVTALFDRILCRDLRWRGRRYKLST